MEDFIEGTLTDDAIAEFAKAFEESKETGGESEILAKFQYAYALLRSKHNQDIKHGISLMENLYYEGNKTARRDYVYYIAMGHTRLKQYALALDCVDQFLQFEPENHQAKNLRSFIKEKMTKDGLMGMAITGGALVIGGLIGLGISMARK